MAIDAGLKSPASIRPRIRTHRQGCTFAVAARADDSPRTQPPSRNAPTSDGALADALRRADATANARMGESPQAAITILAPHDPRQAKGDHPAGFTLAVFRMYVVDDHPGGDGCDNDQ